MLEQPISLRFENPEATIEERVKDQQHSFIKKCICEMCTCGKYHCPKPRIKGIFETTYKNDYIKYPQRTPAPLLTKEPYKIRHYDPSSLVTSYDDYNKTSELIKRRRDQRATNMSENKYQTSVLQNSAKSVLKYMPKFDGVSEYKDHFKGYPMKEKSKIINYSMQNIPVRFDGESSYKKDYKPYFNSPVIKNLQTIQVDNPNDKKYMLTPNHRVNVSQSLQHLVNSQDQHRLKTQQYNYSYSPASCPCEHIPLPAVNQTNNLHLKYDPIKKQWQ